MTCAPLTRQELEKLPPVLDPPTAGRLLGIGRTTTYSLLAAGAFPAPAFRAGKRWRIPTAGVCHLLGIAYPPPPARETSESHEEEADDTHQ
ncbi:helix-turn-helix domain-containing protein [Streptomonospora sp. PA3]|uniref:helix-turn-helix domain-containing protein n=1 Tax=Streptomonospora sp. PA3 TaxID=2607326 RepID=UPI0016429DB1|nr:helix-turn-helix domain-containing protein [Streptomonospora sp. PA3]